MSGVGVVLLIRQWEHSGNIVVMKERYSGPAAAAAVAVVVVAVGHNFEIVVSYVRMISRSNVSISTLSFVIVTR